MAGDINKNNAIAEQSIEKLIIERRKQEWIAQYPDRDIKELERYLPPSDPYAFLIEDSKLTPQERRWQKFFSIAPWFLFLSMAALPYLTLNLGRKYLLAKEEKKVVAAILGADVVGGQNSKSNKFLCRGLERIPLAAMVDVVESGTPTVVLMYSSATFHSKFVLALVHEIGELFKKYSMEVRFVAVDLSDEKNSMMVANSKVAVVDNTTTECDYIMENYPAACGPYLQIVCAESFAYGSNRNNNGNISASENGPDSGTSTGENIVLDYGGSWVARDIVMFILKTLKMGECDASDLVLEEVQRMELDEKFSRFKDELMNFYFVNDESEKNYSSSSGTNSNAGSIVDGNGVITVGKFFKTDALLPSDWINFGIFDWCQKLGYGKE